MSDFKITIKKYNGNLTRFSRELLEEKLNELGVEGEFYIGCQKKPDQITKTRYKYYFDCVMFQILWDAGDTLQFIEPGGIMRPVQNTAEVHACMRAKYNSIVFYDSTTQKTVTIAGATKGMSDRKFIGDFMQNIMAEYAGPPHNIEFIDIEDWRYYHNENDWDSVKEKIKNKTLGNE